MARPLTDKELLIKKIASKLMMAEKTIETVINHQFISANSAMDTNQSIEISGFGKFMFNEKKAARRLKTYMMKKHDMHTIITHPQATAEQIRKATIIYNDMVDHIALLKPNISNEFLRDLRGLEEQVDSPSKDEGDDTISFQ
jgi:nucleoid DNA-binding protein